MVTEELRFRRQELREEQAEPWLAQVAPDVQVLRDLKLFVKSTDRSISKVVSEAVREYIFRAKVRPAFRRAMDEVLDEHDELLSRLAK